MTGPTRLRQREILHAQLAACQCVDSSYWGVVAALSWLTTGGPAPLTGALSAALDFGGIVRELAAAEAIIYGRTCTGRDYARGVEHALLWAEFATAAPPVPPEDRIDRAGEPSTTSISPRR